ncbi:MAG: metal-dependent hydrolase [Candidatus Bathyarchaeota archaeon]|nr:MAG: metal-dependent hydrolase [Candidatus Bathyarchaeota archaeon]
MEPAFHLILPTILAVALGIPVDTAFFLSPLSLLFDFDIFLNAHRRFHSLAIFTAIAAPTAFLVMIMLPDMMVPYLVGLFYLGSHLLLDIFTGEMALFYPFSPKGYGLKFKIQIDNTPLRIGEVQFGVRIIPEIGEKTGSFTLLSGQGAVAILLSSVAIFLRIIGSS